MNFKYNVMFVNVPQDIEIKQRIETISDPQKRNAVKYQYLIAGSVDEVSGKYTPSKLDVRYIDDLDAVLFIIKTARHNGRVRGCLLPKRNVWVNEVYTFIKDGAVHPFQLHNKYKTSKRYYQWLIEETFNGLSWPSIDYKKIIGTPSWSKKLRQYSDELVQAKGEFPFILKAFSSSSISRARRKMLIKEHGFNKVDIKAFTGWTTATEDDVDFLVDIGTIYLQKLEACDALSLS